MTRRGSRAAWCGFVLFAALAPDARADAPIPLEHGRLASVARPVGPRSLASRTAAAEPFPNGPWAHSTRISAMQGLVTTTPHVFDDGSIVVGVAAPPTLQWIDVDRRVRASAPLDDRPTGELAIGADGRVYVSAENRMVYVAAPDGTVREQFHIDSPAIRGPVQREDGSVFIASTPSPGTTAMTIVAPSGEIATTDLIPQRTLDLAPGNDGCLWLLTANSVACVGTSGVVRDLGFGRGAMRIAPLARNGVALVTGNEVQIRESDGSVRGRIDAASPVQSVMPLANGGLGVVRTGPPAELWIATDDGTVTLRVPIPAGSRVEGLLVDSTGALLIATVEGVLTVLEPDGSVRWTLSLQEPIAQSPIPLPTGGVLVVLAGGGLMVVR